jgi:hypothetical protein
VASGQRPGKIGLALRALDLGEAYQQDARFPDGTKKRNPILWQLAPGNWPLALLLPHTVAASAGQSPIRIG